MAGFTILELIVVIAILVAMAAIGAGSLAELHRGRVFAATNELAGWLEAVRRAAERGIACDVTIPNNSDATSTTNVAAATPQAATIPNHCLQNSPFRIDSGRGFDRYSITSNINTFTFTPRGSVFLSGGDKVIQVRIQAVEGGPAIRPSCVRVESPLGLIEVSACEEI